MMRFEAVIYENGFKGYLATCPSLPACKGHGRTQKEALERLRLAVVDFLRPVLRISPDLVGFALTTPCGEPMQAEAAVA